MDLRLKNIRNEPHFKDAAKFAPFRGAGRNQGYIPRRKAVKLRRGERAPPVPKYLLFLYIYVVTGPGLD